MLAVLYLVKVKTTSPLSFIVLPRQVYCDGDDGASDIAIEGGTFSNNEAKWSGGAIALWGEGVVVTVTGGTFANNTAT